MRLDKPKHPTENSCFYFLKIVKKKKKKDQFWPGDEPLLSPEEMLH